jgi:hypothetical protein
MIAWAWATQEGERLLAAVNLSPRRSRCFVRLPFYELDGKRWKLHDLLGEERHDHDGSDLRSRGLYLDAAPWQRLVFEMRRAG